MIKNNHINIGIIGDHQTGKTFLFNKLLNKNIDLSENTIYPSTTDFEYKKLNINKKGISYSLFDTPGLRKQIKTTLSIINTCDYIFLVISGIEEQLKFNLSNLGITKDLLLILKTKKNKKLYILVNKLDDSSISFSKEIFQTIKEKIINLCLSYDIYQEMIEFIPISVYLNENIYSKSENLAWYNGPTLKELIKTFTYKKNNERKPLRFTVLKKHKIIGKGTVVIGMLISGTLKKGDNVIILPTNKETTISSIEYYNTEIAECGYRQVVGLNIKGISKIEAKRGSIIISNNPNINKIPKINLKNMDVYINSLLVVLQHPNGIKLNSKYVIFNLNGKATCFIDKIELLKTINSDINNDNEYIIKGSLARVTIKLETLLKMERFEDWEELGYFYLLDMNIPFCFGYVNNITIKEKSEANSTTNISIKVDKDEENINTNKTKHTLKKVTSVLYTEKEKIEDMMPIKKYNN